jgi:hypothetical protein
MPSIDNGFNSQRSANHLSGWSNGDFNYDGVINGDDYTLIDNAYNSQGSVSLEAVPASQIATNMAQIASTSRASTVAAPGNVAVGQIAAAVANPMTTDNTEAQELKKRRPSAWEMLES